MGGAQRRSGLTRKGRPRDSRHRGERAPSPCRGRPWGSVAERKGTHDSRRREFLEGKQPKSARKEFFYFDDSGALVAVRYNNIKFVFCEQRMPGTLAVWAEPFTCLRAPKMFNLRMDPYERADITSNTHYDWMFRHAFYVVPVQDLVANYLSSFKKFPPRQRPSSFSVDQIMEKFTTATTPKGQ